MNRSIPSSNLDRFTSSTFGLQSSEPALAGELGGASQKFKATGGEVEWRVSLFVFVLHLSHAFQSRFDPKVGPAANALSYGRKTIENGINDSGSIRTRNPWQAKAEPIRRTKCWSLSSMDAVIPSRPSCLGGKIQSCVVQWVEGSAYCLQVATSVYKLKRLTKKKGRPATENGSKNSFGLQKR